MNIVKLIMKCFGKEPYKVEIRWKEILIYREGENELEFFIPMGVKPPWPLEFPSESTWNKTVPDWAKGRRNEIMKRISKDHNIKIVITND
jgi:hypothetical protein